MSDDMFGLMGRVALATCRVGRLEGLAREIDGVVESKGVRWA